MIILYLVFIVIILIGIFTSGSKITKKKVIGKKISIEIFYPLVHKILNKTGFSNNWSNTKYQNISFRLAVIICMTLTTSSVLLIMGILNGGMGRLADNKIRRPDYQEDPKRYSIEIYEDDGSSSKEMELEVTPREYTLEEVKNNFTDAYEYLMEIIKNENESLDKVTKDLYFPREMGRYSINIDWNSSNYDLVNEEGKVFNQDFTQKGIKRMESVVTAVLKYGDYESDYPINITIYPKEMNGEQNADQKIENALEEVVKNNKEQEYIELPQEVGGIRYSYKITEEDRSVTVFFLGVAASILWIVSEENKKKQKVQERQRQLTSDYSEVVSKLTLLSGAGMTIYRAWERIVLDYRDKAKDQNGKRHYAYEEMLATYHQIKSGVSEAEAYIQFGRRCNLKEYVKLGVLLQQNLKKGTKGLAGILENESIQAFEQRKNQARKLGEEAGTKLLIPMILMLIVTMVIVIFPAFLSMDL